MTSRSSDSENSDEEGDNNGDRVFNIAIVFLWSVFVALGKMNYLTMTPRLGRALRAGSRTYLGRIEPMLMGGKASGSSRLSFVAVFLLGLFTAAVLCLMLSSMLGGRTAGVSPVSPHGLLPSSSFRQYGLDEITFGPLLWPRQSYGHDDQNNLMLKTDDRSDLASSKNEENSSSNGEALASLNMALEMKSMGKQEKALRLFEHAMALQPSHPDILNHYGEFLEEEHKDIIQAEHLYTKALIVCPGHSRALSNRQRTLPQVEKMDRNLLDRIDGKRDQLSQIPEHSSSLRRVKKEAYFMHIYHTVALEGNTMSLAQTRHIVETRLAVAGKSIVEHNEILGLDAALSYINSSLVQRIGAITVQDILEIHKRVLGYADPLEAGMFRRTQVFVGGHIPPHPSDVNYLMKDFLQWINSPESMQMHPVRFAALAHYKLVFIHPFTDGNGRTGRLLMNLILMQAGFPPVIIRKQDRQQYYDYLEIANRGDIRPFIRFIAECTEKTLDVYLYATKEYPDVEIPALEGFERNERIIIV